MSHDTLLLALSDGFIYRVAPYEQIDRVSRWHSPLVHNSSGIPVAKCWRNRVNRVVVDGTNRKETLFFTFNMFHR